MTTHDPGTLRYVAETLRAGTVDHVVVRAQAGTLAAREQVGFNQACIRFGHRFDVEAHETEREARQAELPGPEDGVAVILNPYVVSGLGAIIEPYVLAAVRGALSDADRRKHKIPTETIHCARAAVGWIDWLVREHK